MDLRAFFEAHIKNGMADALKEGFQRSEYVSNVTEPAKLMRTLLSTLSGPNHVINQLQSGALSSPGKPSSAAKKQSFCTDFAIMVNNILGLLGAEFSMYLFILYGLGKTLVNLAEYTANSTTYSDILRYLQMVRNIVSFPGITVDSEHVKLLDEYIKNVTGYTMTNTLCNFELDRSDISDLLLQLIDGIQYGSYVIDTVDKLCIDVRDVITLGYDQSFLKAIQVLYLETFIDYKGGNISAQSILYDSKLSATLIDRLQQYIGIECNAGVYVDAFEKYYRNVFDNTARVAVTPDLPEDSMLTLVLDDGFVKQLGAYTFILFATMSHNIIRTQRLNMVVGKSARIQFAQLLSAFVESMPRSYVITESQYMALHYILLPEKVLVDAMNKYISEKEQ